MNIEALKKIAAADDDARAAALARADVHADYQRKRQSAGDSRESEAWATGLVGGGVGAGLTVKGVHDWLSRGPETVPAGHRSVYGKGIPYAGTPTLETKALVPTGRELAVEPHYSAIVKRPKIAPRTRGKILAGGGAALTAGSLLGSYLLGNAASENRARANEHLRAYVDAMNEAEGGE